MTRSSDSLLHEWQLYLGAPKEEIAPRRAPVKIGGEKRGLIQRIRGDQPRTGRCWDHNKNIPPAPSKGGLGEGKPAPPRNELQIYQFNWKKN